MGKSNIAKTEWPLNKMKKTIPSTAKTSDRKQEIVRIIRRGFTKTRLEKSVPCITVHCKWKEKIIL